MKFSSRTEMFTEDEIRFIQDIHDVARECAQISHDHGFHEARLAHHAYQSMRDLSDIAAIGLAHSELGELTEAIRKGGDAEDEHVQGYSNAEIEAADTIIRLYDLAHMRGWRLGGAILAKMDFNRSREFMHGKAH